MDNDQLCRVLLDCTDKLSLRLEEHGDRLERILASHAERLEKIADKPVEALEKDEDEDEYKEENDKKIPGPFICTGLPKFNKKWNMWVCTNCGLTHKERLFIVVQHFVRPHLPL